MYQVRESAKSNKPEDRGALVEQFQSFTDAKVWLDTKMEAGEERNLYICKA